MNTENRLRYCVVSCSSEDEQHPVTALMMPKKRSQGWHSKKFCAFPQEMIFQFEGVVNLQLITILSHEYKISSRIDIYAGETPQPREGNTIVFPTHKRCKWRRLGYITLDSNEESEFRARELRRVELNENCSFLKFVLGKCHVNKNNMYSQISLIAVQFCGDILEQYSQRVLPAFFRKSKEYAFQEKVPITDMKPSTPDYDKTLDNISLDPATKEQIQQLSKQKKEAVEREDYAKAKFFKEQIESLKLVYAKLVELENQKKLAVEQEDYDRAMLLKQEIEKLKRNTPRTMAKQSEPSQAIKNDKQKDPKKKLPPLNTGDINEQPLPPPTETSPAPEQSEELKNEESENNIPNDQSDKPDQDDEPPPEKKMQNISVVSNSSDRRNVVDRDEVPISTGQSPNFETAEEASNQEEITATMANRLDNVLNEVNAEWEKDLLSKVRGGELSNVDFPSSFFDLEEPPDQSKQKKGAIDAQRIFQNIGKITAASLISKSWHLRESILQSILSNLDSFVEYLGSRLAFAELCHILSVTSDDKIAQIFFVSSNLLSNLLSNSKIKQEISNNSSFCISSIDPIISVFVSKTANSNARTKKSLTDATLQIVKTKGFGPSLVVSRIQKLQKKEKSNWKVLLGRFELLHEILNEIYSNFSGSVSSEGSMSTKSIMEFVNIGFSSQNGKARNAAIKVAIDMYKFRGIKVDSYFSNIKNALKTIIQDEMRKTEEMTPEKAPIPSQPPESKSPKPQKVGKPHRQSTERASPKRNSNKSQDPQPSKPINHDDIPIKPSRSSRYFNPTEEEIEEDDEDEYEYEEVPDDYPEPDGVEDRICPFCGMQDDRLVADSEFEAMHWLEECPMLMACPLCRKITEIATMNNHLLEECSQKEFVVECPRCLEAIPSDEAKEHIRLKQCEPAKDPDEYTRCPLCHQDIENWEAHILINKCPMNPRTKLDFEPEQEDQKNIRNSNTMNRAKKKTNSSVRESDKSMAVKKVSRRVFGVD